MLSLAVLKEWLHRKEPTRYQKLMLVSASLGGGPVSLVQLRKQAHLAGWKIASNWNLSDIMKRTGGLIINTPAGWELTDAGKKNLKTLGAPITLTGNKDGGIKPGLSDHSGIHPQIQSKCDMLYISGSYAEAVEKSFKVVRDRLRSLTGHETGSEAFGKGKLYIRGATAPHVDHDFNEGAKFLTMAIDKFRNEKSHTSDANISDPLRAQQYLMLSSLAMYILDGAEIRP